jgi:hypothetical protein
MKVSAECYNHMTLNVFHVACADFDCLSLFALSEFALFVCNFYLLPTLATEKQKPLKHNLASNFCPPLKPDDP